VDTSGRSGPASGTGIDREGTISDAMSGISPIERFLWSGVIRRQVGNPTSAFTRAQAKYGSRVAGKGVATLLLQIPAAIGILVIVACSASQSPTMRLFRFVAFASVISLGLFVFFRSISIRREGREYREGRSPDEA